MSWVRWIAGWTWNIPLLEVIPKELFSTSSYKTYPNKLTMIECLTNTMIKRLTICKYFAVAPKILGMSLINMKRFMKCLRINFWSINQHTYKIIKAPFCGYVFEQSLPMHVRRKKHFKVENVWKGLTESIRFGDFPHKQ